MKAVSAVTTTAKIDGSDALVTVARVGNGGTVRIVSTLRDNRMYSLVALVPTVWKDNAEVDRFFASFHFATPTAGSNPATPTRR